METLEQLQAIIDGAPSVATHYSNSERVYYTFKCECWMWCHEKSNVFHFFDVDDDVVDDLRSLSDIKRIIELERKVASVRFNFNSGVKCVDIPDNLAM